MCGDKDIVARWNPKLKMNKNTKITKRPADDHTDDQIDLQTDGHIDGQTDGQKNKGTDRQTDTKTDRHTDRYTDILSCLPVDLNPWTMAACNARHYRPRE